MKINGIQRKIEKCQLIIGIFLSICALHAYSMECHDIKSSENTILVTSCEDDFSYQITASEDVYSISKFEFQTRLNEAVTDWWYAHNLALNHLQDSKVEIWITLPDSSPSSYQLRAVIDTHLGRVVFGFNARSSQWAFSDENVAILANQQYPKSFGWRPQSLLVNVMPNVDQNEVRHILHLSGISMNEQIAPGWYTARTAIWDEQRAADRVKRFDKNRTHIKSANLNKLIEWVGFRGKAFTYEGTFHE